MYTAGIWAAKDLGIQFIENLLSKDVALGGVNVPACFAGRLRYRFDVNLRSSMVLGLVGANGVSRPLIVVVDQASTLIRRKLAA